MHGIIMVWFFLIPSIPNTLGNFFIPMMIGAKDLAFPKLNLLSWYVFMLGGCVTIYALFRGGVDTGWTFYTPFSTYLFHHLCGCRGDRDFHLRLLVDHDRPEFIATIHRMRAPGLTWFRLPIFIWSMYATSLIFVLATPVLAITLLMVGGGTHLFRSEFSIPRWAATRCCFSTCSGSTRIRPFTSWSCRAWPSSARSFPRSRASRCSAIKPSRIQASRSRCSAFWSGAITCSSPATPSTPRWSFRFFSYFVAVPSAIKVFNWTATIYKGSVSWDTPMLYAIGFIGLFTIGGMTGLFLAALGLDVHVTDTYFVIAHFHYIMVGGTVMAYLGGVHYWWPKISGKMYPGRAGAACRR